jgi:hypothetical protein
LGLLEAIEQVIKSEFRGFSMQLDILLDSSWEGISTFPKEVQTARHATRRWIEVIYESTYTKWVHT